jgi:hypothetical protein
MSQTAEEFLDAPPVQDEAEKFLGAAGTEPQDEAEKFLGAAGTGAARTQTPEEFLGAAGVDFSKVAIPKWQEPGTDQGMWGGYAPGTEAGAAHQGHMAEAMAGYKALPGLPFALAGKAGEVASDTASRVASQFLTDTGIDPSAMPGREMWGAENFQGIPWAGPVMALLAPEAAQGINERINKILAGFTEPGQAAMLPFSGLKPVQALFGAQALASLPDSVREVIEAKSLREGAGAVTGGLANLAMTGMIGKHVLGDLGTVERGQPDWWDRPENLTGEPAGPEIVSPFGGEQEAAAKVVAEAAAAKGEHAEQVNEATQPDGNVQQPGGTGEGTGTLPADESSEGVSEGGQGEEIQQAQEPSPGGEAGPGALAPEVVERVSRSIHNLQSLLDDPASLQTLAEAQGRTVEEVAEGLRRTIAEHKGMLKDAGHEVLSPEELDHVDEVRRMVQHETGDAPDVDIVHRPNWRGASGYKVHGSTDPVTGRIRINAAVKDMDALRKATREEMAHRLLSTDEGRAALQDFMDRWGLSEAERAELERSYVREHVTDNGVRRPETDAEYSRRLTDEYIAKQARAGSPFWQELVDHVKQWLSKRGLVNLTRAEAARAILRRLKTTAGERVAAAREPAMAERYALSPEEERDFRLRAGTRNPVGKTAKEKAVRDQTVIDMESFNRNPNAVKRAIEIIRRYMPETLKPGVADGQVIEQFIDHIKNNLLWLHDKFPEALRARAAMWYEGARRITLAWEKEFGVVREGVAAVIALLSPQRDWFANVELGRRVLTTVTKTPNRGRMTPEMDKLIRFWIKDTSKDAMAEKTKKILRLALPELRRKPFKKLETIEQAVWLRAWNEAHESNTFNVLNPEGTVRGVALNDDGITPSKLPWPPFATLGKAIEAIGNPDLENISRLLGKQHKVRNFYNNIINPNEPKFGDVTIDTHAVAGALIKPLAAKDPEVMHNFGNKPEPAKGYTGPEHLGTVGDDVNGLSGLYALYAEAYRKAAKERGNMLPRKMQSITWEAVRGLFQDKWKTDANKALVSQLWNEYDAGGKSLDELNETREAIYKLAGGIKSPDRGGPGGPSPELPAQEGHPADAGELSGSGQGVRGARTVRRGDKQSSAANPEAIRGAAGQVERYSLEQPQEERATGQKIQASQDISDQVKANIHEWLYTPRTNEADQQAADRILKERGLDGAQQTLLNPPGNLPGAVRVKLLGTVTQELSRQEQAAFAAGQTGLANNLAERQGRVWDTVLPQVTDMAQSLQAMDDVVKMSPDGQVARVRLDFKRQADAAIGARQDEVNMAQQALQEGHAAGVEALRKDPQVVTAANAAVNHHVVNSPETHAAVLADVGQNFQLSPAAMRHLEGAPLAQQAAKAQLRTVLDDLGKRAAGIAAGFFQGAEQHAGGLAGLLQERLGLTGTKAGQLARGLEGEFRRQVEQAKQALPKRAARLRVARDRAAGIIDLNAPMPAVDRALHQQLGELNQRLGELLRSEAGRQDLTHQHIAERLVERSGLTGEPADTLRTVFRNRWDAIVNGKQRAMLRALERQTGNTISRPIRTAFDKAAGLYNLGGFTGDRWMQAVRNQLKLPDMTTDQAAELRRLVIEAQKRPEGFLRDREKQKVIEYTERLAKTQRWWDVPMAIFYGDTLSGFTTPVKIVLENLLGTAGNLAVEVLAHPKENLLHPVETTRLLGGALGRGLVKGALQAESTLRTGLVTGIWEQGRSNIMEQRPFGRYDPYINYWKYISRVIGTAHELTFSPAWEFKQTVLARRLAMREGLRGEARRQRVADLMANTDQQVASARAQALQEFTELGRTEGGWGNAADYQRRVREIIQQRREGTMPGSTQLAREFALRISYLNEPYGLAGIIAKGMRSMLEEGRVRHPLAGTLAKTQVPFTTVAANLLNEKLNWTPVGLARAALADVTMPGGKRIGLYGWDRKALPGERQELVTKALLGTAMTGALAYFFLNHIHGAGPADPRRRKQLAAAGWIPHSFEWGGKYYYYMHTPLALPLAVLGNIKDWHRYGKGDEADSVSRMAFALKGTFSAMLNQGMLDSVRRLFEAIGSENTAVGGDKIEKLMARTATAFVVPNLVQQVDRIFDPTVYDQTGVHSLVLSQIPFVRRENKPVLNVLGEPVKAGPFHHWVSEQSKDPVWRFIADRQVWVPEPSRSAVLSLKAGGKEVQRALTDDEYYRVVQESGPRIKSELQGQMRRLVSLPREEAQAMVTTIAKAEHERAMLRVEAAARKR